MTDPLFKGLNARLKTSGTQAINCRCRGDAIHFQGNCRWSVTGIKCMWLQEVDAELHNKWEGKRTSWRSDIPPLVLWLMSSFCCVGKRHETQPESYIYFSGLIWYNCHIDKLRRQHSGLWILEQLQSLIIFPQNTTTDWNKMIQLTEV